MAPADPHLLASAVVLDSAGRHVLLVRDEELPRWRLPAEHVHDGEPLAETARRAVREHTHLVRFVLHEPHLAVQQDLCSCGGGQHRHIDHVFAVVADAQTDLDEELGGSDLAAGWFPTDALPRDIDPGVRLHLSQAVRVTAAV
jgi:ADP-ribose pyrophosphatase YjhB (NUDIX family)